MNTYDFSKVDFSRAEVCESLARAYAVVMRIKVDETDNQVEHQQTGEGQQGKDTKKIQESPGATGVAGEAPKPKRKPKQSKKETPPSEYEQLRLF